MEKKISGIPASRGIAIAKAYVMVPPDLNVVFRKVTDVNSELNKLDACVKRADEEINIIKEQLIARGNKGESAIFDAHLTMLHDPEFISRVKAQITEQSVCAEFALQEVTAGFITIFESMDDPYLKARVADISDISRRIMHHLLGVALLDLSLIREEVVLIAADLTPSDTAQLDKKFVKGFVTDIGGRTSHSAIMARSMEIPAIVGTETATKEIKHNDLIIVDGLSAQVLVLPNDEEISHYTELNKKYLQKKSELRKYVNEKSMTADGHETLMVANIGSPNDLDAVINNGAEGIGLYRTEFLYMESEFSPSEDVQFAAYRAVLEAVKGPGGVVVRTLDIGGDKKLSYLPLQEEMNPFLGLRAVRLCLQKEEMFRTQLSALLRASGSGNLKIMFPMIATLDELRRCKEILLEEKARLISSGVAVSETIEIGIMIEIPSAALIADKFAEEVDFFSIGTNDLIQYTMAADRMNKAVSYLYQPYHPSILRLIKMVVDAAHKKGKWVGMCGEMAGEELAIPLLFGLGLDEFSMSATSILRGRAVLKRFTKYELEELANKALELNTQEEVLELLQDKITIF